jgi:hypothetical protein
MQGSKICQVLLLMYLVLPVTTYRRLPFFALLYTCDPNHYFLVTEINALPTCLAYTKNGKEKYMHYDISSTWVSVFVLVAMWDLAWKGVALWRAAHNNHLGWYVALLIINSAGLLPIIYLLTHRSTDQPDRKELHYETPFSVKG